MRLLTLSAPKYQTRRITLSMSGHFTSVTPALADARQVCASARVGHFSALGRGCPLPFSTHHAPATIEEARSKRAVSTQYRTLWVKKEGGPGFVEVAVHRSVSVPDLRGEIARTLNLTGDPSTLTLHVASDQQGKDLDAALDSRHSVKDALPEGANTRIVVKGAAAAAARQLEAAAVASVVCDDDLKRRTHARLRAAAFKAAMLKAEVQDIEGGCQLLVLPNDAGRPVHWLGLDSSVLFVRPVFKHFYEELLREFTRDTTSQRYHNLLRGVSGIGKSSFGMYALWRLARDGRNVLYEYPTGLGRDVPLCLGTGISDVYIADGCEPRVAGPATLLISSPCGLGAGVFGRPMYHQFKKDAASLYMPPPTPEEVLLMSKYYCFADMGGDVAEDAARERMRRWGPIPRQVLRRVDDENWSLDGAIEAQRVGALQELVSTGSESVAARDVSFDIVHYKINETCSRVTYGWASEYVGERVVQKLRHQPMADRLALLAEMLADNRWLGMSSPLWEWWCDTQMAAGGSFRIRRLGVGSTSGEGKGNAHVTHDGEADARLPELFKSAEARLGATIDSSGEGELTVPRAAGTKLLGKGAAQLLPDASKFGGWRYQAKACFAAADFIEASGICSGATVKSERKLLLLGKDAASHGMLPIVNRLHPDAAWGRGDGAAVPFLWLMPPVTFKECRAGVPEIEAGEDAEARAKAADLRSAAAELARCVVQYAVEIPPPARC